MSNDKFDVKGETIMSGLPSGSKIAGIAAHIAIIGFFLPWITVSCYGSSIGNATGYGLAVGTYNSPWGDIETSPLPALFVVLVAAILLALLFYVAYTRGSVSVSESVSQIVVALGVLVLLAAITIKVIADNTTGEDATLQTSAQPQFGLLLTVGSFATVVLASYLAIVDIRRGEVFQLRNDE